MDSVPHRTHAVDGPPPACIAAALLASWGEPGSEDEYQASLLAAEQDAAAVWLALRKDDNVIIYVR